VVTPARRLPSEDHTRFHRLGALPGSTGSGPHATAPGGPISYLLQREGGIRWRGQRSAAAASPPRDDTDVMTRLGCLFVVVPLVELALLIQVGQWVGVWPTVLLVAITGLAGLVLVRREGTRTLIRIQTEVNAGRLPHRALLDGAFLLVAGAFLMTPGVLTDVLAFALLLPRSRSLIARSILARLRRAMEAGTVQFQMFGGGVPPRGGPGFGPGPPRHPGVGPEDDEDDSPPPRPGEIVQD